MSRYPHRGTRTCPTVTPQSAHLPSHTASLPATPQTNPAAAGEGYERNKPHRANAQGKGAETSGANSFDRCVLLDPEREWAHTLTADDLIRMLYEGRPVSDPNPFPRLYLWRKQ